MITENRDLKCPHYFIYCEVIAIASFQSSSTGLNVTCSFFAFNPGRGGEETAGICKFCRTRYAVRTHQPRFAKHFVRVVSRNSIHGQSKYIYIYISILVPVCLPLALPEWRRRVQSRLWCINCSFLVFDPASSPPSNFLLLPLPARDSLYRDGKGILSGIYHFRFSFPRGQSGRRIAIETFHSVQDSVSFSYRCFCHASPPVYLHFLYISIGSRIEIKTTDLPSFSLSMNNPFSKKKKKKGYKRSSIKIIR